MSRGDDFYEWLYQHKYPSRFSGTLTISAGVMGNMADFPLTVNTDIKIHHYISVKYPNFSIGTFRDYARLHANFP
jgi:hypothetical protein